MQHSALERDLRSALAGPLPGPEAQVGLAPRPRFGWRPGRIPEDQRQGACLLLLYPQNGETHLVLTLRASGLEHHAGQVSLPGGAVEPGESIEAAALREAGEEVGIDAGQVRVLGRLSPLHIPVSGYVLYPVVGITDRRPDLRPDPLEVDRIVEVPLSLFRDGSILKIENRQFRGRDMQVPVFNIDGVKLWGATAMVLSEFLWLVGIRLDPWE